MSFRVLPSILLSFLCLSSIALSQSREASGSPLGIPRVECRVTSSADSLYFRGNDYIPNQITVTVSLTNTSADTAKDVVACMVQDTRFIIASNPCSDPIQFLLPAETRNVTFILNVASARANDGYDTLRTVVTSSNGASAVCETRLWVEHEYYPTFIAQCEPYFTQIVFDDTLNDYTPNPFVIGVRITNVRDGASDSTFVQYLGTRGVAVDTAASSIHSLGTLDPGKQVQSFFDLHAIKRNNDTTVSLCFQVIGKGGYKRKTYVDSCCIAVFIPRAKQAEYNIICNILPDSIEFKNHRYEPDPFDFEATITNIGTAIGKEVKAQIILPPSVQLSPGETITKPLGDVGTGASFRVQWSLKPTIRFQRDTVKVCIRVSDMFENSAICCDSVIIDSIRSARFDVSCSIPDSIRVDVDKGVYVPMQFPATFTVCNVGSDYADSVKATMVIQSPDVINIEIPQLSTKRKVDITGSDTLEVKSCVTFTWMLEAIPRAVSGNITIKFKAEALNAPSVETECRMFIPKLDAPQIESSCETVPTDSIRFDSETGGYRPNFIIYTLKVINPGGGVAKNVRATLALPPRILLGPGEQLSKQVVQADIGPKDTAYATWFLIPIERRDFGSMVHMKVEVVSDNVSGSDSTTCSVFVPALPRTAALILPQDPVGYFGQLIAVPIHIDDPEGKDIKKFDFVIDVNVDGLRQPLKDQNGGDLIVARLDAAQQVATRGTLIDGWNASATHLSDHRIRVTAESVTGTPLSYPPPSVPVPALLYLIFRAEFGNSPNEMAIARTELLWPPRDSVESLVLINDGSVFPRVTDGVLHVSGDCIRPLTASEKYVISQNIPNPFNPSTTIQYAVSEEVPVRVSVFDTYGRTVQVLVDRVHAPGSYSVVFTSTNLPSGMYFYRMDTPGWSRVMKMVVAK